MLIEIDSELRRVFETIQENGGVAYVVGGAVRDAIMGFTPKDLDIEVFKMKPELLIEILSKFGNVDTVGKSFGVFKLTLDNRVIDFSVPRKDSKTGIKHTDFLVEFDPFTTVKEAAKRRDFTMNAIYFDPLDDEIIDPFNGCHDIERGYLNYVDQQTFADDPLRVLRGMEFCGRFDLIASHTTLLECYRLRNEFNTISKERIWIEWEKWASKSIKPSRGIVFLVDTHWINHFLDLGRLEDIPQDKNHHPEGGVLSHTCYVVDEMAIICQRENIIGDRRLILMFSALCHDFGKATTTEIHEDGSITSFGHDMAGEEPTRHFLDSIGSPTWLIEPVVSLVKQHMQHIWFQGSTRQVRRLATKVNIEDLVLLAEADHSGRPPLDKEIPPKMLQMLEIARNLNVQENSEKPILMGRHLIELGLQPSKRFGDILKEAFEAQLNEEFSDLDGAITWFKENNL